MKNSNEQEETTLELWYDIHRSLELIANFIYLIKT